MSAPMIVSRRLDDELERGALNLETGEFQMTLATDGEASDGHILNIDGAITQPRMPLLFNHSSTEAIPVLGSVVETRKEGGKLRATGRFNLSGEDQLADLRRGIAQLVSDGDLRAVSVRWEGTKSVRRTALPESHPHYVKPGTGGAKEWGHYFEKWRVLEGSVVSIGADPKALIGRAQSEIVRAALRSVLSDPQGASDEAAARLQVLADCIREAREAGMSDADLANAVSGQLSGDLVTYEFGGGRVLLPRPAWDALRGESLEDLRLALSLRKQAEDELREEPEDTAREVPVTTREEPREPERKPVVRTVADMPSADFLAALQHGLAIAVESAVRKATGRLR